MSCMGRNMWAQRALFSPVIYAELHVTGNFQILNPHQDPFCNSKLHTPVGAGNAFTFAPALRHGRRTDIDAAASTRNFGACAFMEDSCNACPALFAGDARPHVVRSRRAGAKARA